MARKSRSSRRKYNPFEAERQANRRVEEWQRNHDLHGKERKEEYGNEIPFGLQLQGLRLERVPESVRGLHELEDLNLGKNRISELPSWLGELTALKRINFE